MALPVPNLDDRTFQDLVDDAKRLVQQRCPSWTDHNVSDPGVTLIETFAWMTDQLLYRLNRVPDRLYVKFLELLGVRLFPPTAARAPVTLWLSTPPEQTMRIPAGTRVATPRSETEEAVVFSTVDELDLVPTELVAVATQAAGTDERISIGDVLQRDGGFTCFAKVPRVGDALLLELREPVPHCALRLRFRCDIEGVGVDPLRPPLAWDAWDGEAWHPCEVDHDDTGGLNRDGDVVLHVPASHAVAVLDGRRGGFLRARVVESEGDQPRYQASPTVRGLGATTVGGTVDAVNAELVQAEGLGASDGTPGQRLRLHRGPVLAGVGAPVLESSSENGWQEWSEVGDFAASSAEDRHFILDAVTAEIRLGPALRQPDGTVRFHGAIPPQGEQLRLRAYAVGGGRRGNVARGTITVLKSSIPYVSRIENRCPALGGVDGEDIENAKERGPIVLRTRGRAVTAEDFEQITREGAPEVARVRCLAAGDGVEAGSVRILVVPAAPQDHGRIRLEDLVPQDQTLEAITQHLDRCRLVGTRVLVEPPLYRGVTVVARLVARPRVNLGRVQAAAIDALFDYLNPITGGPDGGGWPFGRPVHSGDVFALLQRVSGVELAEDVRIFGADPISGARGTATQRLEVEAHALVFSYNHQVRVESR